MLHLWIYLQPLESTHWVELSKWQSRIQDSFSRAYCSHGRPVSAIPYPEERRIPIPLRDRDIQPLVPSVWDASNLPPFEINGLQFCNFSLTYTHPGQDEKKINVHVWLPSTHWYGRLRSTGGGGSATGLFDPTLAVAVSQGYSAAATDGGHSAAPEKGISASD